MIPDIKKILYLTDLSESSRNVLAYAFSLAGAYGAGITVFHAFEIHSANAALIVSAFLGYGNLKEFKTKSRSDIIKEIESRIREVCDEMGGQRPSCRFALDQIIVEIGKANEIISDQVKKADFDLIVMGSHGHGTIKKIMLGSTAQQVVKECRKPVLIVPLPALL